MIELKRGGGDQIFIWFMVGMVAFTVLLLALSGLAIMAEGHPAGVVLVIFALPFIGLTYYVYQEAAARSFTRITINNGALELRLPAQRSYVPQEKVETTLQLHRSKRSKRAANPSGRSAQRHCNSPMRSASYPLSSS